MKKTQKMQRDFGSPREALQGGIGSLNSGIFEGGENLGGDGGFKKNVRVFPQKIWIPGTFTVALMGF